MILKWLLKIFAFALVLLLAFVILLVVLDAISQAKKFHFNRKQKAFFLELKKEYRCKAVLTQDWQGDPYIFISLIFDKNTKEGEHICASNKQEFKEVANKIAKRLNELGKIAPKYILTISFEVMEKDTLLTSCDKSFEFRNTE